MNGRPDTIMVDGKMVELHAGSGNVFADLGVANPEEQLAKAILSSRIARLIGERSLTQSKAAELLGLKQPDVSNLVRGRLSGWSVERLMRMLNRLGQDVEITVRPARDPEQASIRVPVV
jgi:predicted XRE-type DNA-binding protein